MEELSRFRKHVGEGRKSSLSGTRSDLLGFTERKTKGKEKGKESEEIVPPVPVVSFGTSRRHQVEQNSKVVGVGKTPDGHLVWAVESVDGEAVFYENAFLRKHRPMLLLEWYASKLHFDTSTPLIDTFRTPSKQEE
jgi:hypothetical protein